MSYTSGATIFEANGIYRHNNGEFTIEKTLRIELLFIEKEQVMEIVNELKRVFNQESIAIQEQTISSELV